jgi:hypothetical protein
VPRSAIAPLENGERCLKAAIAGSAGAAVSL